MENQPEIISKKKKKLTRYIPLVLVVIIVVTLGSDVVQKLPEIHFYR